MAKRIQLFAPVDVIDDSARDALLKLGEIVPADSAANADLAIIDDSHVYRINTQDVFHRTPSIVLLRRTSSDAIITLLQEGAEQIIFKPFTVEQLIGASTAVLEERKAHHEAAALSIESIVDHSDEFDRDQEIVGQCPALVKVFKKIARYAQVDATILIRGETGTGKELVARAIYHHSNRRDGPYLAVNCAAMSETLLESELFGHEKGSFTGADRRRIGKFEQCDGGTIFLDEVGDMSPLVQSKVLRVLQEQQFERVGGNETIATNVRILSATNRRLEGMVEAGNFRKDLYHRLAAVVIVLPPLRERGEDITLLLQHYLLRLRTELNRSNLIGLSEEAFTVLSRYPWPGNIRELQGVLREAALETRGPVIGVRHLPDKVNAESPVAHQGDE